MSLKNKDSNKCAFSTSNVNQHDQSNNCKVYETHSGENANRCNKWIHLQNILERNLNLGASSVSNHKWNGKTANISVDWVSSILPWEHEKRQNENDLLRSMRLKSGGVSNFILICGGFLFFFSLVWCDHWCLAEGFITEPSVLAREANAMESDLKESRENRKGWFLKGNGSSFEALSWHKKCFVEE